MSVFHVDHVHFPLWSMSIFCCGKCPFSAVENVHFLLWKMSISWCGEGPFPDVDYVRFLTSKHNQSRFQRRNIRFLSKRALRYAKVRANSPEVLYTEKAMNVGIIAVGQRLCACTRADFCSPLSFVNFLHAKASQPSAKVQRLFPFPIVVQDAVSKFEHRQEVSWWNTYWSSGSLCCYP